MIIQSQPYCLLNGVVGEPSAYEHVQENCRTLTQLVFDKVLDDNLLPWTERADSTRFEITKKQNNSMRAG